MRAATATASATASASPATACCCKVADLAEDVAVRRLDAGTEKVRRHGEVEYAAKAWPARPEATTRRIIARVEAGPLGTDTRFIITNLAGTAEHLYEDI